MKILTISATLCAVLTVGRATAQPASPPTTPTDTDRATDADRDTAPPSAAPEETQPAAARAPGPVLTLEQAQQAALAHHPGFVAIDQSIAVADSYIRTGWSMLLPNLTLSGQLIRNERAVSVAFPVFDPQTGAPAGEQTITIQDKWQKNLVFTASMTLLNARAFPLIKNAYDNADKARLLAIQQRDDLLFAVTSAYYQVIHLQQLVDVMSENLRTAQEFLKLAQARRAVGAATKIDETRAQMQVVQAQRDRDNAEDAYATARRSLCVLIGRDGDFTPVPPTALPVESADPDALTRTALKQRVDVQSARIDEVTARRDLRENAAKWIPKLDVTWQWQASSAEGFTGDKTNWMVLFGATWSLLEGGGRFAERQRRKAQVRIAQSAREELELRVRTQVLDAYQQVLSKRRNAQVSTQLVTLAEDNYAMASRQYEVGMTTGLEVLDTATRLVAKRVQTILDTLAYQLAVLELRRAVGDYAALSQR